MPKTKVVMLDSYSGAITATRDADGDVMIAFHQGDVDYTTRRQIIYLVPTEAMDLAHAIMRVCVAPVPVIHAAAAVPEMPDPRQPLTQPSGRAGGVQGSARASR
jgi:hypothetical protein